MKLWKTENEQELEGGEKQITEVGRNWIDTLAGKEISRYPQISNSSVNLAKCQQMVNQAEE